MNKPLPTNTSSEKASFAPLFLRLFWMGIGVGGLATIAMVLWSKGGDASIWWSISYWLFVGMIVVTRYVDIRYHEGQTVDLEPADLGHWKRHTAGLVPVSLVLWLIAI